MSCFTEEANKYLSNYIQHVRKDVWEAVQNGKIDEPSLNMFLSELEQDIRLISIKLTKGRGEGLVAEQDVSKVLRNYWVAVFWRKRSLHLDNMIILEDSKKLGEMLDFVERPLVLDVGCGWGKASLRVNNYLGGKAFLVGIDLDGVSLEYGKSLNHDICFLKAHMTYLPFRENMFDLVVVGRALHEVGSSDKQDETLVGFTRVLKYRSPIYIWDQFAKSHMRKFIRSLIHKLFKKTEVYSFAEEFEGNLKRRNFRIIKKNSIDWFILSLNTFCYYIAENTSDCSMNTTHIKE